MGNERGNCRLAWLFLKKIAENSWFAELSTGEINEIMDNAIEETTKKAQNVTITQLRKTQVWYWTYNWKGLLMYNKSDWVKKKTGKNLQQELRTDNNFVQRAKTDFA